MCHIAIEDDGDIASGGKELHHFRAGARQLGPAGRGVGVLFKPAQGPTTITEIDLAEPFFRGADHGEAPFAQLDCVGALDEGLTPDGEQSFLERHEREGSAAWAARD